MIKYLPYGENLVTISQVVPKVALLKGLFLKKLTQAEHIACRAGVLLGINKTFGLQLKLTCLLKFVVFLDTNIVRYLALCRKRLSEQDEQIRDQCRAMFSGH